MRLIESTVSRETRHLPASLRRNNQDLKHTEILTRREVQTGGLSPKQFKCEKRSQLVLFF